MKENEFDVFVIGSGSAGQTVAKTCVENGLQVAIADHRAYGGTCPNRGCDPKKVLLGATEAWEFAHNLSKKSIVTTPDLNWGKLQKFKKTFTKAIPVATENKLTDLGIQLYHQSPKFIDEKTLSVEGKKVRAKHIVIATGLTSRKLDFKGSDHLKISDDFLNLKKIPKSIVFIGAGYIGMEFAHMAARAGSTVTIIERGNRPLSAFDADLVSHLTTVSEKLGIRFIFNSEIKKVKKLRKNIQVHYLKDGKNSTLKARMVFNTAGRVPSISQLQLNKGNVAHSAKGIKVNSHLQSTSNANVYACGDVSDNGVPLTPLSGRQGHVVSQNILHGNKKKIDLPVVPSAVFTLPNLASVGLSEEEARKRYKNVTVNYESVPHWFNAKRVQESAYAYKIISNSRTQTIVGAHILSGDAAETINLFAMAITNKTTTEAIKKMIFTYPSWCNDIKSMV
jgi:glutathione reductase (NADPH)